MRLNIGILLFKNREQITSENYLLNDLKIIQKDIIESVDNVGSQLLSLTSGNSALLGKFEENILEKYLKIYFPYYEIENTATSGMKCGDIIVNTMSDMGKISINVKIILQMYQKIRLKNSREIYQIVI